MQAAVVSSLVSNAISESESPMHEGHKDEPPNTLFMNAIRDKVVEVVNSKEYIDMIVNQVAASFKMDDPKDSVKRCYYNCLHVLDWH